MKTAVSRLAVAGALALSVAPLAGSASASCGPVLIEACRVVCQRLGDVKPVYTLCTVTR